MNFLDVKTDYAFKKVFGSEDSKDKLISFLNAIVYENKKTKIKDLTIVDPYNVPLLDGMKNSFVDVKAILDDDTKVIIEMQVLNHQGFEKRVLYNLAKNYSVQLNKAEDFHLLNPVIALNIVDFTMFKNSSKIITNFKLLEKEEFIDYSDDIELIFVELPKFKKELKELKTISEQWIYFIKNAGSLEYIPNNLDKIIQNSLDALNEANLTKDELEAQHKRKEFISIQKLAILKATNDGLIKGIEQGIEKGIEQGIEKGIEQRNIEIAKNLLDILDDKTISLKTGLEIEMIESLRLNNSGNSK
jgi:predicted transposase/invertase (TIGR01784 family)